MIRADLELKVDRASNIPLPLPIKLAVALKYYATGDLRCHEPVLAVVPNLFLFQPVGDAEVAKSKLGFFAIAGLPGIVTAIDCTQIPIRNPDVEIGV